MKHPEDTGDLKDPPDVWLQVPQAKDGSFGIRLLARHHEQRDATRVAECQIPQVDHYGSPSRDRGHERGLNCVAPGHVELTANGQHDRTVWLLRLRHVNEPDFNLHRIASYAERFERRVNELVRTGIVRILDLSEVTYIDSAGLRALSLISQRAPLRLVLPRESRIYRAVTITGFDQLIAMFETVELARDA